MAYHDGWGYPPKSTPRKVSGGIKAKSKRGSIGDTWWSRRWIGTLESFGWENRLQRGKSYARSGQVLEFKIYPGSIEAEVQGSAYRPYDVKIKMIPFTDDEWDQIVTSLSKKASYAAKLLAGEVPEDIEEAFADAGKSLFPQSSKEITTYCSCPDQANTCKHIAAVYYIVAEEFDRDPFMIFKLRGITKEKLLDKLGKKRAGSDTLEEETKQQDEGKEGLSKIVLLHDYWTGKPRDHIAINISKPEADGSIIRILGIPEFWDSGQDYRELMKEYYRRISDRALSVAYKDTSEEAK